MRRAVVVALVAALAIGGCGGASESAQARTGLFVAERTGGFAGVDDRLVVRPSGVGRATDREGKVTRYKPAATRALRRALRAADFGSLRSAYRPEIGAVSDGFRYRLRYGGRTIVIEQGAKDVPPRLERVLRETTALIGG